MPTPRPNLLALLVLSPILAGALALACSAPDESHPAVTLELVESAPATAAQRHDVMESAFCASCHPDIYAEHEQSTHGRAFTDEEVRLATARFAHQDCIVCHTPRPIFETGVGQNPKRRHYGLHEGNTCMTCHWKPDYDYGSFTGGAQCKTAFHPDVGTVEAGATPRSAVSRVVKMLDACDIVIPVLNKASGMPGMNYALGYYLDGKYGKQ